MLSSQVISSSSKDGFVADGAVMNEFLDLQVVSGVLAFIVVGESGDNGPAMIESLRESL